MAGIRFLERSVRGEKRFRSLFNNSSKCSLIGMVHIGALPGTPRNILSVQELIENACADAEMYKQCSLDGLIVENMNDIPYVTEKHAGPELISCMTAICSEVRKVVPQMPCGVQILAGNNKSALAVALASGFQFIRAECFVFSHIADEGMMHACAGDLLRYRHMLGADNVFVLTDIKKKHCSHAITSDLDVSEVARAASFFLSDGLVVTGARTGDSPSAGDLESVKSVTELPVLIGSGVTVDNLEAFLNADGLIIGSHFKKDGVWHNNLDKDRILKFVDVFNNRCSHH